MAEFVPYVLPLGAALFAVAVIVFAKLSRRAAERHYAPAITVAEPVPDTTAPSAERMEALREAMDTILGSLDAAAAKIRETADTH